MSNSTEQSQDTKANAQVTQVAPADNHFQVTITTGKTGQIANDECKQTPLVSAILANPRDLAEDIGEIIEFAKTKLSVHENATYTPEMYLATKNKIKEFQGVVDAFSKLLERGNSILLDEKAQLMKRLEEIQRAMKPDKPANPETHWGDVSDSDDTRKHRAQHRQSISASEKRGNSPIDSHGESNKPSERKRHFHRRSRGHARATHRNTSEHDYHGDSEEEVMREQTQKPRRAMGSRVPPPSANPLKRRVIMDDLEGFSIVIRQDVHYGQIATFGPPFDQIMIGGALELVPERPVGKPSVCEPLYLEGMCNCSSTQLVLHAGKPLHIAIVDFVGILHKFINNYSGNAFRPNDSRNYVDANIIRCVIHAIALIKGIRRGQLALTIGSFADATEPKNLFNAVADHFHMRNTVNPMGVARGLFVALATHFVSS